MIDSTWLTPSRFEFRAEQEFRASVEERVVLYVDAWCEAAVYLDGSPILDLIPGQRFDGARGWPSPTEWASLLIAPDVEHRLLVKAIGFSTWPEFNYVRVVARRWPEDAQMSEWFTLEARPRERPT